MQNLSLESTATDAALGIGIMVGGMELPIPVSRLQPAQPHLADAVFVEVVVVAQDGDLVGHGGTNARPVVDL